MRCSPRPLGRLGSAVLLALACAGRDDVVERDFPSTPDQGFVTSGAIARAELVHAAYLPRGVEFEVLLTNISPAVFELERAGILLAYEGLEYPLDLVSPTAIGSGPTPIAEAEIDESEQLQPGDERMFLLQFRIGRAMTETGWIVWRALRADGRYTEPLWLEVPGAPSRSKVQPRGRRGKSSSP